MKVLVIAYACEPGKGSEPGVGWNWVRFLSKELSVTVITRKNNKELIEKNKQNVGNVRFIYYDLPRLLMFWKRGRRGMVFYNFLWQLKVAMLTRKLLKKEKFDLIHHLTFGNILLPIFTPFFVKIPVVWGPLGGVERIDISFLRSVSLWGKINYFLKRLYAMMWRVNPLFIGCLKRVLLILCKTKDTLNYIPYRFRKKAYLFPDIGWEANLSNNSSSVISESIDGINDFILVVGDLTYWRGVDIVIRAHEILVKKFNILKKLVIVGDGVERKKLVSLTKRLGLNEMIYFTGSLRREEYLRYLKSCDICVNPSLKEGGVTFIIDAITLSKPIVYLNTGTITNFIKGFCGVGVEVSNYTKTISELAHKIKECLERLENKEYCYDTCLCRERIADLSWEIKVSKIKSLYRKLLHYEHPNHP